MLAGDYVTAIDISGDGKRCVAGLGDGSLLALDVATGRELFRTTAHASGVLGTSISPDGMRIATCGQDPDAKLWTLSGELVQALPGGGARWCEHVAWAPAGGRLATASGRIVRVWTATGEPWLESAGLPPSTATGIAWRPDGTEIAASCYGGVHILPVTDGASLRRLAWKGSLIAVTWIPDGKVVAGGCQDCGVHFWRLPSGQDAQMSGYPCKRKAIAWDRDATLLATTGDPIVTIGDSRGKGPEGTRPIQLQAHQAICTPLDSALARACWPAGAKTPRCSCGPRRGAKPIRLAFLGDEVTALAWHPLHKGLLAADASGTMCMWETD